eukprot:TRINITY_DN5851_c0_g1_i1.p1 TRINITY_DN5851_c0_g1~~TRINITY_DN5851_c0_g1_i1.p1  ORF type:complete len:184 (-),score=10.22 TRINITY_DN5851_c0_g1_i1:350-901(-)
MQAIRSFPLDYPKWQQYYPPLDDSEKRVYMEASRPSFDWQDMVYRYDSSSDTFRLFFVKTPKSQSVRKIRLTDRCLAAQDTNDKIVYLEFEKASQTLGCHLFDYPLPLDNYPPCTLTWSYDEKEDALDIHLMDFALVKQNFHHNAKTQEPFEYDIIFDNDRNQCYLSIEILEASKILCKKEIQ